jgi:hypothetical protein
MLEVMKLELSESAGLYKENVASKEDLSKISLELANSSFMDLAFEMLMSRMERFKLENNIG